MSKKIIVSKAVLNTDLGIFEDKAIVVENGKIFAFIAPNEISQWTDAQIIDLKTRYILPGLINTHVHLEFSALTNPYQDYMQESSDEKLLLALKNAEALLQSGVTTARDAGSSWKALVLTKEIVKQRSKIPRLIMAGPPLTVTGGHLHFLGGEADSIPELIKAVRLRQKKGAESIKIIVTGGGMTPGSHPESTTYTAEEIKTVVDTATHLGMTTFAHCHTTEGFVNSMEGNIGCIEHCSCFVLAKNGLLERVWEEKVMNQFKGKQKFFMGGLSIGWRRLDDLRSGKRKPNEKEIFLLEQEARFFKNFIKLVELGMRPVVGTDAGVVLTTFDETWFELELMVKAGLSPLDALKAATINGAECLEMEDAIGKIDMGYSADLIAATENPLKNINTLKNVEWVMLEGEIVGTVKNNRKKL